MGTVSSPRRCYSEPTQEAVLQISHARWVCISEEEARPSITGIGDLTYNRNRLLEPTFLMSHLGLSVECKKPRHLAAPIPPRIVCQKSITSVCSGTVLEMLKSVTVSIGYVRKSLA
jgi:hypothetical protein